MPQEHSDTVAEEKMLAGAQVVGAKRGFSGGFVVTKVEYAMEDCNKGAHDSAATTAIGNDFTSFSILLVLKVSETCMACMRLLKGAVCRVRQTMSKPGIHDHLCL